jgi:hypothetical protein
MANLLDIIKKNTSQAAQVPAPTAGPSETAKAAELLRAKSGKDTAGLGPGVGQTNLAERAAVQESNTVIQQQIAPAVALQNEKIDVAQRGIQQEETTRLSELNQRSQSLSDMATTKMQGLLQELDMDGKSLDFDRDRAKVDQIMTTARLANKKYVDTLQLEGERQRLNTADEFRNNLLDIVFGSNLDMLKGRVDFADMTSENDRNYRRAITNITIDDILKENDIKLDFQNRKAEQSWQFEKANSERSAKAANLKRTYTSLSEITQGLVKVGISTMKKPPGGDAPVD